jgi:transketolase
MEPLAAKWESFGFVAREVDGHDVAALHSAFASMPFSAGKPTALICRTVKGKGVPPAENNPDWHHKNKLSDEEKAIIELALGEATHA